MNGKIRLAIWLKRILNLSLGFFYIGGVALFFFCIVSLSHVIAGHKDGGSFPLSIPVEFSLDTQQLPFTCLRVPDADLVADTSFVADTTFTVVKTQGVVLTTKAGPVHRLALGLGLLLFAVVMIWELLLFRRILLSVIRGEPFDPANAGRIRWIGLIVIGWTILSPLTTYLWGSWMLSLIQDKSGELQPAFTMDFSQLWIGLGIIVLAEVFRQGTRLKEDQSLTI